MLLSFRSGFAVVPSQTFNRSAFFLMCSLLCVAGTLYAQSVDTATSKTASSEEESLPPGVYTGRGVVTTNTPEQEAPIPAARSFSDGFLRNTNRHFGLSLSLFETYTPDVFVSAERREGATFTFVQPKIFTNFDGSRSHISLVYGFGFRRYNSHSELDSPTHTAAAEFRYRLSSKASLELSDDFRSAYNDEGSFGGLSFPSYQLDLTPQIHVLRQRQTWNSATIGISDHLTKNTNVTLFGKSELLHYGGGTLHNTQVYSAGFGLDHRISKRFHFNTQYSHSLNHVADNLRNTSIQNLQIAGFAITLGKDWTVSSSGGVESTGYAGHRWITGSGQIGIAKSSEHTTIGLAYDRGYSTVFPAAGVWNANKASVYFVHWLSRRVNFNLNSVYTRGSILGGQSHERVIFGSTGFDIAIQNDLVLSTNYSIASQRLANVFSSGTSLPNVHRYTVSVGVQYYLPSVVSRSRNSELRSRRGP
jgi:hypothetical protein